MHNKLCKLFQSRLYKYVYKLFKNWKYSL